MWELVEVNEKIFKRHEQHWQDLNNSGLMDVLEKKNDPRSQKLRYQLKNCQAFFQIFYAPNTGQALTNRSLYCKNNIICPTCSKMRQWILSNRINAAVRKALLDQPDLKVSFITLSPKNYRSPKSGLKEVAGFRSQIAVKANRRTGRNENEFHKFIGGASSIDVTHTGNKWNIHIHLIALHHEDLDKGELQKTWDNIVGYKAHLNVQDVLISENRLSENVKSGEFSVFGRCRYLTKPHKLEPENLHTLALVCKNFKFLSSFGILRGAAAEYVKTNQEEAKKIIKKGHYTTYRIYTDDGIYHVGLD